MNDYQTPPRRKTRAEINQEEIAKIRAKFPWLKIVADLQKPKSK